MSNSITIAVQHCSGVVAQQTLPEGSYLIGREAGDLILDDPDVSATHARLDVRRGRLFVTDLGSTNGTFGPDQQRVKPDQELYPGKSIRLGRSSITRVGVPAGGTRTMQQMPEPLQVAASGALPSTARSRTELELRGRRLVVQPGTVLKASTSAYSATHVSGGQTSTSYGASGYTYSTTSPITSHTTHHTLQEIWVRTTDGRELPLQLRDTNVEVREGHEVSVLVRRPDAKAVRVVNHTTGYWYRTAVYPVGFGKRVWDCIWPFFVGPLMALWCLNILFVIGANIEALGPKRGWDRSNWLLKLVALSTIPVVLTTYWGLVAVGEAAQLNSGDPDVEMLWEHPTASLGVMLFAWLVIAYYVIRAWNIQRMAKALDREASRLL